MESVKMYLRKMSSAHFLRLATLVSVLLLVGRIGYTRDVTYIFLMWNLFLAWAPYGLAVVLERIEKIKRQPLLVVAPLYVVWLFFFPNAPYVLTDFIHLDALRGAVPLWYDVVLVGCFGVTGLVFGLMSLAVVHGSLRRRWGRVVSWVLVTGIVLLSGFGVYLGRFPRWNSWDVIAQPRVFLLDVSHRLSYPWHYPNLLEVTLLFSGVTLLGYFAYLALTRLWHKKEE
jgi:uncharacterized membrane protein